MTTRADMQVSIEGGIVELSLYSPRDLQVLGLNLDNFTFTAPSGNKLSLSLDRLPYYACPKQPPSLDHLLTLKTASDSPHKVRLRQ